MGIAADRNTCSGWYLVICPGVVKTLCHRIAHPGVSVYTRRTVLEILLFVEHRPISHGSDTEHTRWLYRTYAATIEHLDPTI